MSNTRLNQLANFILFNIFGAILICKPEWSLPLLILLGISYCAILLYSFMAYKTDRKEKTASIIFCVIPIAEFLLAYILLTIQK